jgi:hypothetical protein
MPIVPRLPTKAQIASILRQIAATTSGSQRYRLEQLADDAERCAPFDPHTPRKLCACGSALCLECKHVSKGAGPEPRSPSVTERFPSCGILGDLLCAVMPHVEANEMAIAVPFLIGMANLMGRGPHFVAGGTEHYLQFYAALVGSSAGARKSTAINTVLALLRRVDPSWAACCQKITLLSGDGLVACLHDRHLFDDRDGDKRLFLVDTGLESTIRSIRRPQNTLSPILSDLSDEGIAHTRSSKNPLETTDALVSLIGDFNVDDRLSKLVREKQTGLDRRFLWFFVERSKSLPRCRRLPIDEMAPLVLRLKKVVAFAKTVGEMQRSKKAERLCLRPVKWCVKVSRVQCRFSLLSPWIKNWQLGLWECG